MFVLFSLCYVGETCICRSYANKILESWILNLYCEVTYEYSQRLFCRHLRVSQSLVRYLNRFFYLLQFIWCYHIIMAWVIRNGCYDLIRPLYDLCMYPFLQMLSKFCSYVISLKLLLLELFMWHTATNLKPYISYLTCRFHRFHMSQEMRLSINLIRWYAHLGFNVIEKEVEEDCLLEQSIILLKLNWQICNAKFIIVTTH